MSSKSDVKSEPGGEGQSLPVAGTIAACAASLSVDSTWLRDFLQRVLGPTSTLQLHQGARDALMEQAIEIVTNQNPVKVAIEVADGYLSASNFETGQAVPLVAALLQADVINTTLYDSRSREAFLRFIGALRLPPRILYRAEADLAALVHALAENATKQNGHNIEAVPNDEQFNRQRKTSKWLKIGTASVVGGLALGISGGLIAPALLPALSSVGLASVSAPLAAFGGGGAVAVGGLFGAAGAGVGAVAMANRTGEAEEFKFEVCTAFGDTQERMYKKAKISPSNRIHEAVIPLHEDKDNSTMGGLLVWELLTSQEHAMVIPGGIEFGIRYSTPNLESSEPKKEWLLPEQRMDVGGLNKHGEGRRRRSTGAITVHGPGNYILCFQLLPGSLAVNLSYRVAFVPQGKDPPLWVMEESENQKKSQSKIDMRSLSMTIFIPGLLVTNENGPYPGMCADQFIPAVSNFHKYDIQCFALRWESHLLIELGRTMQRVMRNMAIGVLSSRGAMMMAPAVVGAISLPLSVVSGLRNIIENIWAKVTTRASECGYMLACELASRSFGNRPVTLAGYSCGGLVVFSCLQELARRKLVGIVHDACLIGAPCTSDFKVWRDVRSVVSGRLINAYNPDDWFLDLANVGSIQDFTAGTRPIQDPEGLSNVENVDLSSEEVRSHWDYVYKSGHILVKLGICDPERRRPWSQLTDRPDIPLDESTLSNKTSVDHIEKLSIDENAEYERGEDVEIFNFKRLKSSLTS